MMTRSRILLTLVGIGTSTATVLACVDLFHTTDFATLCEPDAAACTDADVSASEADAEDGDAADAALEPIDFCKLTSAQALIEAEHACAWLSACEPTIGGSAPGSCMRQALLAFDCRINPGLRPTPKSAHMWRCLARAKSCDEVAQCAFGGQPPSCDDAIEGERCVDGTVVRCGERGSLMGIDVCALGGKTCTRAVNSAECTGAAGVGECQVNRCIGTWVSVCVNGKDEGYDCTTVGEGACVEAGVEGDVACAPATRAEACKGSWVECDPATDKVKGCVVNRAVEIDCRGLGGRCDPSRLVAEDPARACTGPGTECGPALCQSNYVRGCDRGIYFSLACSEANLKSCDAGRCTP